MRKTTETCRSPLRENCASQDIAVYIYFGGKLLPICWRCWEEIVKFDLEWERGDSEEKLKARVEEARMRIHKKDGRRSPQLKLRDSYL